MWGSGEAWKGLIERFESDHPGIEVEFYEKPFSAYFDTIFTMIAAGTAPDLIVSNPQHAPIFVERGVWLRLDPLIERDRFDFSLYLEPAWAYTRFNGSIYAWPAGNDPAFHNHLFAYNRDLFAQAGLPYPTATWTFADLRDFARKLTRDTTGDGAPDVYGVNKPNTNWYWNWVWSNGGRILSDDRRQFLLAEPAALDALQFVVDLGVRHQVVGPGGNPQFLAGKLAIVNTSFAATLRNTDLQKATFDWSVVPYPGGKAGSVVRAGDLPMGINKASRNVEAAWTFLKWMVQEDVQRWAVLQAGLIVSPVHRRVALSNAYLKRPTPPYDITSLVMGKVAFLPVFARWADMDALVRPAIDKAWTGTVSVAAALQEIAGPVQAILKEGSQ